MNRLGYGSAKVDNILTYKKIFVLELNLEADPVVNGARRVAFISADDDDAKKRVQTLLENCGYSVVDLGNLRDGGLIQQAGGPLAGRDFLERGAYPK